MDYLVAAGAAVVVLVLMTVVFKMAASGGEPPKVSQKTGTSKPQISQKKKKKQAAKEREEAREQKEIEEILEREISRNPGLTADSKTVKPEVLETATKKMPKNSPSKKGAVASPPQKEPAPSKKAETKHDDGFKPVAAPSRAPKKEKARPPPSDFEIDEEMEKKLAAFFNRSDRRSRGFSSIASPNEPEHKGNYVRIKEDFSTDSKW